MKALSIRQPWAWLIVSGYKDVENRTWGTKYRGLVLIHAGREMATQNTSAFNKSGIRVPLDHVHMGGIVGAAEIVDCVPPGSTCDSPWYEGEYGLVLQNARPLSFLPWKGRLGLFNVPDDDPVIKAAVLSAL